MSKGKKYNVKREGVTNASGNKVLPRQAVGDVVLKCGRTFKARRTVHPYSDRRRYLLEWDANCTDCGAAFTVRTTARPYPSSFFQRCEVCRQGMKGKQATQIGRFKAREYLAKKRRDS